MSTEIQIKRAAIKRRDAHALRAKQRRGGPMKHRSSPRGGARNTQRDLLDEWEDDPPDSDAADEASPSE